MRFSTTFSAESPSINSDYTRVTAVFKDVKTGTEIGGVAEGTSILQAKLRAAAEAYERLCFSEARLTLNKSLPYGLGVGLRKDSAIRRAYAEFYERNYLSILKTRSKPITSETKMFETPYGKVYVAIFNKGLVGSGYGFTENAAQDSAYRSYLRVKDIPQEPPVFQSPSESPQLIKITPKEKWLECYFVGYMD